MPVGKWRTISQSVILTCPSTHRLIIIKVEINDRTWRFRYGQIGSLDFGAGCDMPVREFQDDPPKQRVP